MIIFGTTTRDRKEDSGNFHCPQCACECSFSLVRTHSYFHVYYIPVFRGQVVAERVDCQQCHHSYPLSVLAASSNSGTGSPVSNDANSFVSEHVRNLVQLTDAAYDEILLRFRTGGFASDVVIRIAPNRMEPEKVSVAFDYAMADARDWMGQSRGMPIVISRDIADELTGRVVDYRDGAFQWSTT